MLASTCLLPCQKRNRLNKAVHWIAEDAAFSGDRDTPYELPCPGYVPVADKNRPLVAQLACRGNQGSLQNNKARLPKPTSPQLMSVYLKKTVWQALCRQNRGADGRTSTTCICCAIVPHLGFTRIWTESGRFTTRPSHPWHATAA